MSRAKITEILREDPKISLEILKNDYKLGKVIGKGTYSKVCVATTKNNTRIACKVINKRLAGEDYLEKFLPREIEILKSIHHPNIICVYKMLETNNSIYMFMDYCQKGDLLEYVSNHGALSEKKAKHYFRQITEAVNYLHSKDVAHRDLKCENVFIMWNNQIKLGDFGFVRECKSELSETYCGSAAYASPELLMGLPYDPKMYDIWALGCVLFIMVTATMPFDDQDVKRMITHQLTCNISFPSATWALYSGTYKNLVTLMLEPNITRRPTIQQVKEHPWLIKKSKLKIGKLFSISSTSFFSQCV